MIKFKDLKNPLIAAAVSIALSVAVDFVLGLFITSQFTVGMLTGTVYGMLYWGVLTKLRRLW